MGDCRLLLTLASAFLVTHINRGLHKKTVDNRCDLAQRGQEVATHHENRSPRGLWEAEPLTALTAPAPPPPFVAFLSGTATESYSKRIGKCDT